MDFGKVKNIENTDFTIPEDHPDNAALFAKLPKKGIKPKIYVGCPAWGEKSFVGKIYPAKTKASDFVYYYSQNFATIEFNSTYYALPKEETIKKWCSKIPPDFKVCPKVPYGISHEQELLKAETATEDFRTNCKYWGEHFGIAFLVLPPHFGPEKSQVLCDYVVDFPRDISLAIEFRDPAWFSINEKTRNVFRVLEENDIATVITDVAGRRDCLHQRITSNKLVVRFVGNDLHPSDYQRLEDWGNKLHTWFREGLEEVHFFIHEPQTALAVDAAVYFIEELENKDWGITLKKPQRLKLEVQQTFF